MVSGPTIDGGGLGPGDTLLTMSPRGSCNRIVGKGNHSANHVQKIKPGVEKLCRDLGLQYATEENAGRMYINLTGGPAQMPPYEPQHKPHQQHGGYPNQPPEDVQQNQEVVNGLFRKLTQICCVVM